ncbi:MAG TPA: HAD family phosphatase [bacterium]|nr:HAD family phosphatase [bacterium]
MSRLYDALILDMDGVVVDTEPIIFTTFRKLFEPFGISFPDAYLYRLVGDSTRQNLVDIARDYPVAFDAVAMEQALHDAHRQALASVFIPLRIGITRLLDQAREIGLQIGLCTSSQADMVEILMQRIGSSQGLTQPLHTYFSVMVTGDRVRHPKPNPEPYSTACRLLGVAPGRSLAVEDSATGLRSAKAAGCWCVGLRSEYNQHMDFSPADQVVHRIDELVESNWLRTGLKQRRLF